MIIALFWAFVKEKIVSGLNKFRFGTISSVEKMYRDIMG